jgi:hypothetical protein
MPAGRFALATLATWRVTHLLAEEDGPADAVVRLRRRAGSGWTGDLLDCFYCLSVWVAVPCSAGLAGRYRANPLWYLAVSGAACLLEQATRPAGDAHPYNEHGAQQHGETATEPALGRTRP